MDEYKFDDLPEHVKPYLKDMQPVFYKDPFGNLLNSPDDYKGPGRVRNEVNEIFVDSPYYEVPKVQHYTVDAIMAVRDSVYDKPYGWHNKPEKTYNLIGDVFAAMDEPIFNRLYAQEFKYQIHFDSSYNFIHEDIAKILQEKLGDIFLLKRVHLKDKGPSSYYWFEAKHVEQYVDHIKSSLIWSRSNFRPDDYYAQRSPDKGKRIFKDNTPPLYRETTMSERLIVSDVFKSVCDDLGIDIIEYYPIP